MEDLLTIILSLLFIVLPAILSSKKKKTQKPMGDTPKHRTTEDILRELLGEDFDNQYPVEEYQEPALVQEPLPIDNVQPQNTKYSFSEDVKKDRQQEELPSIKPVEPILVNELSNLESPSINTKGKLEIDTKKMILYSEILKPKYMD